MKTIDDIIAKVEEIAELKNWVSERLASLTTLAKEDDLDLLLEPPTNLDILVQKLSRPEAKHQS